MSFDCVEIWETKIFYYKLENEHSCKGPSFAMNTLILFKNETGKKKDK